MPLDSSSKKYKVGILGATGMVGQRFVALLSTHPCFVTSVLGASPNSAGKKYSQAANWRLSQPLPERVGNLIVCSCDPNLFNECDFVFSGLDSNVAGKIEMDFLKHNIPVFSNAKNYRMDPLVPLVVPLANSDHLALIPQQRLQYGVDKGFIVTNANCASTGLCVTLYPLHQKYGIDSLVVHTLQAVSGAGYPGCSSMDVLDNVVPYISDEEEKVETEPQKILGTMDRKAAFKVSSSCNRVPVVDGHTENIMIRFSKRPEDIETLVQEVKATLGNYVSEAQQLGLPSAPAKAILVREEPDRPQPRLDRDEGHGNTVVVGRIRPCSLFDIKLTLLSHNTILGAAGSAILNAELAIEKGYL